jgi:hypothetical protein
MGHTHVVPVLVNNVIHTFIGRVTELLRNGRESVLRTPLARVVLLKGVLPVVHTLLLRLTK